MASMTWSVAWRVAWRPDWIFFVTIIVCGAMPFISEHITNILALRRYKQDLLAHESGMTLDESLNKQQVERKIRSWRGK